MLLSVSGSAKRPAVVECPRGIPLGAVLDICQAPAGDGVLVGGYHGMWLDGETAYQVPVGREGSGLRWRHVRLGDRPAARRRHLPARRGVQDRQLPGRRVGRAVRAVQTRPADDRAGARVDRRRLGRHRGPGRRAPRRRRRERPRRLLAPRRHHAVRALRAEVFTEDLAAHVFHSTCGRPVRGVLPLPEVPETADAKQLMVDWVRCEGHGLCSPAAGTGAPLRDGLPCHPAHPGAAMAGEGRAAGGADVPGTCPAARHRSEEAHGRPKAPAHPGWRRQPCVPA